MISVPSQVPLMEPGRGPPGFESHLERGFSLPSRMPQRMQRSQSSTVSLTKFPSPSRQLVARQAAAEVAGVGYRLDSGCLHSRQSSVIISNGYPTSTKMRYFSDTHGHKARKYTNLITLPELGLCEPCFEVRELND